MTVSMALRNNSGVSAKTRERIQALAASLGYRPDPFVTKLMYHLRSTRPARFKASICGLTERWPSGNEVRHIYTERLLTGLRERSAALGYAFSLVYFDEVVGVGQLQRKLLSRGIEGLVIMPMLQPRDLSGLLDWALFSTVAVTSSAIRPKFHTTIPQHFDNMLLACQELSAAGYRRIGLAIPRDWDLRTNHRWTGAMTWHNFQVAGATVRPYIGETQGPLLDPGLLKAWLREQKPDAVVSDDIGMANLQDAVRSLPASRRPRIVTLNWSSIRGESGIDQRAEVIGAAAIDILAGMIVHSEKGVPQAPYTTTVLGNWVGQKALNAPAKARDAAQRQ